MPSAYLACVALSVAATRGSCGSSVGSGTTASRLPPVVAALLPVERGRNVAVMRGCLGIENLEECGVVIVVLRLPGFREVGVAGLARHLDGELEAGEREEVVAGEVSGDVLVVAHVAPGHDVQRVSGAGLFEPRNGAVDLRKRPTRRRPCRA